MLHLAHSGLFHTPLLLCYFLSGLFEETVEFNCERIEISEQIIHQEVNIDFSENSDSELSEIDSELSSYLGSSEGYQSGEDSSFHSIPVPYKHNNIS